jgi:uncharacterized protein YjiK
LSPAWSTIRGIAFDVARDRIVGFDPETGDLLQHSALDPNPRAALLRPVPELLWFGFAPTGSGYHDLFVSSGDQRLLTSEWTWNAVGIDADAGTLRATIATSSWSPPSPDASGLTYDSLRDRLIVVDGEVDEMSIYAGANVFECTRTGTVSRRTTTVSYTHEPTDVALDAATMTFYISDDDQRRVWVVTAGPDGLLNSADDTRRSFSVNNFSTDPEGLAFDSVNRELWIAGGAANAVFRLRPGPNGIFDGTSPNGDDQLLTVGVSSRGVTDPEGVGVRAADGGVYVIGQPKTTLLHFTPTGQYVRTITLPSTGLKKPAGLMFAPNSSGPGDSLYVTDRGVDNDSSSSENDGRIFEYGIPGPTPTNQAPVVNAGPDVSTAGTTAVQLFGTVTDDGLVAPVTIQWSKLSGPGTATFTAPTQAVTNASFSAAGTYTCQVSAFDGEFTRTDTCVVTVTSVPVNQPPAVNAGPDVSAVMPQAAHLVGTVSDDGLPGGPPDDPMEQTLGSGHCDLHDAVASHDGRHFLGGRQLHAAAQRQRWPVHGQRHVRGHGDVSARQPAARRQCRARCEHRNAVGGAPPGQRDRRRPVWPGDDRMDQGLRPRHGDVRAGECSSDRRHVLAGGQLHAAAQRERRPVHGHRHGRRHGAGGTACPAEPWNGPSRPVTTTPKSLRPG